MGDKANCHSSFDAGVSAADANGIANSKGRRMADRKALFMDILFIID